MKNNFSKQWDAGGRSRSIIQSLNLFTSRNLFKSLKSILMVVALLSLSSNVWGDDEVYKETAFSSTNNSKGTSSYTDTWTSTNNGFEVTINGFNNNNNNWDSGATIKAGAKKSKASDPAKVSSSYIATSAAIDKSITKIVVYGSLANNNTLVSTLSVADNNAFTSNNVNISGPTSFTDGAMTFNVSGSGLPAQNKFYKVAFTVTNNTTTNGSLVVTKVEYYYSAGPTTYTLTYAAGSGSGTGPAQVSNLQAGDQVTLAANTFTAPSGKKFNGWNDGTSTYNAGIQYTMPSKNVTMTAQWTNITYTDYLTECGPTMYDVKFYTDNGSTQYGTTQSVEEGHSPEAPADPTPASGYAFAGWSLTWGEGPVVDVNSYTINGPTNFYAKWEKKKPTQITLTSSNGYDLTVGDVTTISVSEWLPADLLAGQKGITYSFKDNMSGKATINATTGEVTTTGVCENCTIYGTSTVDGNIKGEYVIHIHAPNYFANNKTIFIMGGSYGNAWADNACVKAWYSNNGGGGAAPTPTWIYDNTYKIFALVMPEIGDYNQIQLQRFASNCSDKHNDNGTVYKSGQGDKNVIISNHSGNDAVAWHNDILHIYLRGSLGTTWNENLGELTDQGAGIFQYTYTNYEFGGTEPEFKWADNFGGWKSGDNVKVTDMVNGSTYNLIATLDVTQNGGAFTVSKELVACKVHFDIQGHGSAIASLTGVTPNSKIEEPTTPTEEKYRFDGWYKEAGCTNAWNFATDEVQETMTLFAKWTRVYTYTFNGEGACANGEAGAGERVDLCADPVITGKSFTGWTVSGGVVVSGSANNYYFTMPSNDVTITAGLSWKTTAITLDKNDGTTDGSAAATYGTGLSNYVAATRAETSTYKYVLTGYYTKKTGGGDIKVIDEEGHLVANTTYTDGSGNWIGEDPTLTLYARWDNYCKVTWVNNGGTVATTYIKQNETVGENMQADLESSAACSDTYNNFVGWYTEASGTETSPAAAAPATKVTASTVVTAKTTYYAVWADGGGGDNTDYSSTYTTGSNVTVSDATGCTVDGDDGQKAGTSKASGSVNVTIPANTTKVYFHMVGWKGEGGKTISVSADDINVTLSPSEFTTIADEGVAGNGTAYTLSGTKTNYSYLLTTSNVTSETELTFANGGANQRFVIWGVNVNYGTPPTGYISTCCASPAVVTVTPTSSALALNIDGQATTTVHFEQTGAGSGRYYEPTITPAEGASLNWEGSYKTGPYNLTFTATKEGSYEVKGNFTETDAGCAKYGSATITVAANPIIAAMKDDAAINALAVNGVCGGEGDANSFVIKSRYLTNAQVTVTATTTAGSGAYKVSKDGTNYSTSVNFTGGQDALGEQTIYVRYETNSESETGTLAGNIAITSAGATTQNVTLSGTCTCSPRVTATMSNNNIVAVKDSWSAGLSEVELSAYNLTMGVEGGVTIKFESTNDNFKLKANTTSGAGQPADNLSFPVTPGEDTWNQNIVVTYKPTTAGATETATITVKVVRTGGSAEYATTQFTVKGYSLPAEFVMATKVDGNWYTMTEVAAASGNTPCPGTQLEVDNATTPTIITGVADGYLPSITVFTPATRLTPNTNAECVRFESKKKPGNFLRVPDDGTYLYFNGENSTSNSYWCMTPNPSVEGEFYIALPNNAYGRSLSAKDGGSGKTTFGHFKTPTTSWRLLPLSNDVELCTRYIAPNVQVTKLTNGSNDVTLKVSSTNGEPETLGYEYSTNHTSWTAMSGTGTSATVTLTGLTKGTDYTYYVRGIVTDETENCSGEKEVTFSPFNPIVTVTPSSLDLTCLAGETDTKTLTITPNADAAGWTIGANPITGANASMFSFNAGTSEVTFSPAVGTADGDYTATLTIKSQAGNASANVTLTGTVVSLATQTISCAAISNGVLCGLTTSTGFVLDGAFYKNGTILSQMSDFNSSSRDVIDVASGTSIGGMNAALSNGVVTLTMPAGTISAMVAGHVYRVTWENAGHDLTNSAGVEYANCYLDFVYSENCDAPTAMIPCVTGPNSAVINWAGDCDVATSTVSVYTKEQQQLYSNSLKSGGGIIWNIWNKYSTPSKYYSQWFYYLKQGSWTAPTSTYGPFINKASTNIYLYTPQIGSGAAMDWGSMDKTDIANIDFTITVDVYCYNNAKSLRCFIVDGEPANTTGTMEDNGKDVYWNGASVTAKSYVSETVTSENFSKDYTLKSFTVRGLTATSRIAFCVGSYASSSGLYVQKVKIVAAKKGTPTNVSESCASGEKAISGLTANTTYFATVTNNGNTSNEVSFKTYTNGTKSLVFKDELSNPVTTVMVLGGIGQEKTITVDGQKLAGCDIQAEVSAGYGLDDSNLTFNSATGAVSGTVVITLTDPTVTEGTFTITDGAGTVYTLNLTSSNCPAGINTMATAATDITDHGANANWSTTVTSQPGTLELYKNGIVNRELIENGGFEANTLAGWNDYEVGYGYSCDAYAVSSTNARTGSYCLSVTDDGSAFPGIYSGFSLIYSNALVLEPGTYRFSAWVKVRNETGNDNKDDFKLAFTGGYWNGSSSQPNKAFVWSETRTVLASEGYVQLTADFELSTTLKCHPVIAVKGSTGTFRDFWLDDVTLIRTSAPINDEPHQIYNIADLSVGTQALTDLSGNTSYSYKLINEDGCESNTITFVTAQPGAPVIEAESITLTASQDKTANGVIIVSAIDAYAPITITSCGDSRITLNVSSVSSDGGAVLVTFNPGSTAPGTSGKCTLSLSTMGLDAPVQVDVNWTVTAGEDVNTPKVDVTEVWTDKLTIEHNVGLDAVDSVYVQFNREKTEEEIVKNVGDEIFFSKYYEATGDLKLWAIFNPTNDTISLAGMEVWRSKSDGTWNTDKVIDLSDAGWYKRGWISPQEEIVVYTADKVGGCEQRHADMTTWNAGKSTMQPLSFSGDDALLLVRNTSAVSAENNNILPTTSAKDEKPISWPDAITERESNWYMLDIIGAHDGLYAPDDSECKTWNWHNSKTGLDESGDAAGWTGYGSDMQGSRDYNGGQGYLLSTNRCLLVRNKDVTSGANALAQNINDMFTLSTEWQGSHVPTSTPDMTQDSVSCVNFTYVGGYNYAGYYNSWTKLEGCEIAAEPNPDGSWTVEVEVPTYSCKMFHIEAVKMDTINGVVSPNVVTSTDYKVPIVVDADNATTADLFNFGGDTCATCDIVVRDRAKLSHVTGGKSQFRELIVYPGAKFDNSSKEAFLLDRITVQSKNTDVGYAIINDDGSSIRAGEVRHVKRIDDQHWYSFSLPYDCKISSIQQQNGKSMGEYAEDWVIARYDGALRQADRADGHIGESSVYWIDMPSDRVLEANKAYIIGLYTTEWPGQVKNVYFPPYVATGHDAYTESGVEAKTANIYNWTEGIDNNPARNHGWNFVGSPYISMFNEETDGQGLNKGSVIMKGKMNEAGEITEDLDHVYISVPADADMMTYNQVLASSQTILPFTGYFVQAIDPTSGSNETLELEYAKGNRTLDNPTLETPERRATATRQRVLVELNVIAPNGDKDNTGIWVDDRYTVDYEIGRDLMKMYGEAGRPQLYSRAADNLAMAYIALPDEQAEYVPLELYAPKAGAYILKIDENTSMTAGAQSIELLYNNEVVANLFFDAYEIAAAKAGTIRGYAVRIRRIAQVTTSNEQIGGQTVTIITNEGKMSVTNLPNDAVVSLYDVLGHRLAMRQAVDGVVNFEAPMTGVYNIVVESAVGQAAIKTVIK